MGYREDFFKANKPKKGKYECAYCGEKLRKNQVDVDHVMPKARGGSNSVSNLTASCSHCNRQKGSMDKVDYEIYRDLTVLDNEEAFERDEQKYGYERAAKREAKKPYIKGY